MIASGFLQHFLHRQKTVDDIQGVKRFSVSPDPVGSALAAGPFDSGGSILDIGIFHFFRSRRLIDIQNTPGVGYLVPL